MCLNWICTNLYTMTKSFKNTYVSKVNMHKYVQWQKTLVIQMYLGNKIHLWKKVRLSRQVDLLVINVDLFGLTRKYRNWKYLNEEMKMAEEKTEDNDKNENEEENEENTSIWRIVETSSPPILSLSEFAVLSLNKISTSFTLRSFTFAIFFQWSQWLQRWEWQFKWMKSPQEPPTVGC